MLDAGLSLPNEIEAISDWSIDIMGMPETNHPWSSKQKTDHDYMMTSRFASSRTIYTSVPSPSHDMKCLPGGNLLTINGRTTGRVSGSGSDEWG